MKIKKKSKNNVLLDQEKILSAYPDPHEKVVMFRDKEMLRIVLDNILNREFKDLLVSYKAYDDFMEEYIRQNDEEFKVYDIRSIFSNTFSWASSCQGFGFWLDIAINFNLLCNKRGL